MKRNLFFMLSLCFAFFMLNVNAQVHPDGNRLVHLWDFEFGNADDAKGYAHGELKNGAMISGGQLQLTALDAKAGFVDIPGDAIEINTFSELTLEAWAQPFPTPNSGANMLMYFGTTSTGGTGIYYLFITSGRFGTNPYVAISCTETSPWANENGIGADPSLGDSTMRHHVVTIKDTVMQLYIDGTRIDSTTLSFSFNRIANISNDSVFIGKAGYTADPTWKGTVELIGLWDQELTADEILWLFQQGEKRDEIARTELNDVQSPVKIYAVNNQLFIRSLSEITGNLSVSIYNVAGSKVYQNNNFRNGEFINLRQGIYIVKADNESHRFIDKIIIR